MDNDLEDSNHNYKLSELIEKSEKLKEAKRKNSLEKRKSSEAIQKSASLANTNLNNSNTTPVKGFENNDDIQKNSLQDQSNAVFTKPEYDQEPNVNAQMYSPSVTKSEGPAILDQYKSQLSFRFNWCNSDAEFRELLNEVSKAIKNTTFPERISKGSSGSYFAKDESGRLVGVFKPKNEEPYGDMNPRWSKCFQRICCPCTFGRNCLLTNQGYLSEAAASIVDRFFRLNVVPRTECVELSSPSFHYGYWIRKLVERKIAHHRDLGTLPLDDSYGTTLFPSKIGSFQLFVQGFRSANDVLAEWESKKESIPPELDTAFQLEFERLVILDYAIRNTDRTMENWMINVSWIRESVIKHEIDGCGSSPEPPQMAESLEDARYEANIRCENLDGTISLIPPSTQGRRPIVKIAAIDNGLAFPYKHPDRWRSYPYEWSKLPWASKHFSDQTIAEFLPMLSDPSTWDILISRLRAIFRMDDDFTDYNFRRQMSVLRGQLFNIRESLRRRESPKELVQRPWLKIEDLADLEPSTSKAISHRILGDTYSADPTRIWHVQGDSQGTITTHDPALLDEEHVLPQYRNVIPPQKQRWSVFVRERPYFKYV